MTKGALWRRVMTTTDWRGGKELAVRTDGHESLVSRALDAGREPSRVHPAAKTARTGWNIGGLLYFAWSLYHADIQARHAHEQQNHF